MYWLRSMGWTRLVAFMLAASGCGRGDYAYSPNRLYTASLLTETGDPDPSRVAAEAAGVVEAWFGTPDEPRWPSEFLTGEFAIVDFEKIARCSGPVGRAEDEIERGLFRKHCVICHGISGDGYGASASMLAPYPRDFRRGSFKFKSTPVGFKPTRDDLRYTLTHGIPGTAMPSFAALNNSREFAQDVDDMVEYVRFLSMRGEIERRLISKAIREGLSLDPRSEEVRLVAKNVARRWKESEDAAPPVPDAPILDESELAKSVQRGKEWYSSELTACAKCHGPNGLGDGASQDYDEWTKDWTILAGIDPKQPSDWKRMKPYGALKPMLDRPRNFSWGAFRGGGEREDLFRRLVLGIEGTPMPPIARSQGGNPGLTDDQIWDLVHYVLSLGGDAL